jgi:hypothetical protein
MSHPIISIFITINIVEVFSFSSIGKKWVWFKKPDIVIDSPGEYFGRSRIEIFGFGSFIFINPLIIRKMHLLKGLKLWFFYLFVAKTYLKKRGLNFAPTNSYYEKVVIISYSAKPSTTAVIIVFIIIVVLLPLLP